MPGRLAGAERQRPFREFVVSSLQAAYNTHRSKKTDGTPQVSPQFFETWRNAPRWQGLVRATAYLVEREKELGNPDAHPAVKAVANLVGSVLLATGIEQWVGVSDQELQGTVSRRPGTKIREAALNVTYGLLFFAQGRGGS